MKCSICNEEQFESPSGISCPNGHGGAPSVESLPLNSKGNKNFEYYLDDLGPEGSNIHVTMVDGVLLIDNAEYEYESGPEIYALVNEVAKHRGLLK